MPHVRGPDNIRHNKMKHPGSTIEKAASESKPRDNLNGDFAGDKNDPDHGTNVKSRKLDAHDRAEGKIPKG